MPPFVLVLLVVGFGLFAFGSTWAGLSSETRTDRLSVSIVTGIMGPISLLVAFLLSCWVDGMPFLQSMLLCFLAEAVLGIAFVLGLKWTHVAHGRSHRRREDHDVIKGSDSEQR